MKEDDSSWPPPDRVGRQELEVILGDQHISFTTTKLGSLMQVQQSKDPEGLRAFYYLVQVRPRLCPPPSGWVLRTDTRAPQTSASSPDTHRSEDAYFRTGFRYPPNCSALFVARVCAVCLAKRTACLRQGERAPRARGRT